MTEEELKNNYEYKVAEKILKQEFSWIKKIAPPPQKDLDKYSLIFLDIWIDPFELGKIYGWEVAGYIKSFIYDNQEFESSFLGVFFKGNVPSQKLEEVINNKLKSIHKSSALPENLKIQDDRQLRTGQYRVIPGISVPEKK